MLLVRKLATRTTRHHSPPTLQTGQYHIVTLSSINCHFRAALACFGDGNECSSVKEAVEKSHRRTISKNLARVATEACGRFSKEVAPKATVMVAKAPTSISKDVSLEDNTFAGSSGSGKQDEEGRIGTFENADEKVASYQNADNENEADEDLLKHDMIANEIVHEWVAYVETIEGRQLVDELGPENVRPSALVVSSILADRTGAACVETR